MKDPTNKLPPPDRAEELCRAYHNAYRVLTERRQRAAASAEDAWTDTWAEEFRVRRARRTTVCPGCRRRDHATDPCPEANHAV